jgi:DNA-binding MarR family transcriptional regulator
VTQLLHYHIVFSGADMADTAGEHIVALDRALRFARARLSPDITAQRLLILIGVYLHEGLSQRELLNHLDSTSITALSRNIADLSSLTTRKAPGPGLLGLRSDPMNLRVKRIFLTRKGRSFVKQWLSSMDKPQA